jgi:hypothetical protein
MESTAGLVKVGSTHQPANRFRAHRKAHSMRWPLAALACRAMYSIGVMPNAAALAVEHSVHADLKRRFGRQRRRDEWYWAPTAVVDDIVRAYAEARDVDALVGLS